jgi:hypothetical protein
MVNITTALPATNFRRPSSNELHALATIVRSACPDLAFDEAEFDRAFLAVGFTFRTAQPSAKRYYSAFVEDANEMLRDRWDLPAVSSSAFLAGCIGHGDIAWQRADPEAGVLLSVGLDPFHGTACSNAWRELLRGRPIRPPSAPTAAIRHASEFAPTPTFYQQATDVTRGWR